MVSTLLGLLLVTAAAPAGRLVTFEGMCDASGAVAIDATRFAVADDEDNILRIYDAVAGGRPLEAVDLSPALPLKKPKKKPKPVRPGKKSPESDLEAATRLGDEAYWLTSHGRNSKGKLLQARFLFFATTVPHPGRPLAVVGKPYVSLLPDLVALESLRAIDLASASERAPKEAGGLNIEGLTAMADGKGMYVGFRNPVPGGKALLVPLLNPRETVRGAAARLGQPLFLDLGGQGIRGLSWWRGRYLIIAGHHADGGQSRLYRWDGRASSPAPVADADLGGLNPEGFFTPESRDEILLLSDDGGVDVGGTACKDLTDAAGKRFRGRWLRLPPAPDLSGGRPAAATPPAAR
jgi:hypothetical protein